MQHSERQNDYTTGDFGQSPFVMFYEVTRACDLLCKHCRACAQPLSHPHELKTDQSLALIDQIATFPRPPVLVFTGGDPFKRADIFDLVQHAHDVGITTALTPSATPLVTPNGLKRLKDAGLGRLALSIDGADAATHDSFRGVPGSFRRTLEIFEDARAAGLSLQVNTTITNRNLEQIDDLAALMAQLGITLWSVFFLVPVGRGLAEQRIRPDEYEYAFGRLLHHSQVQSYGIKTTEAPHYRRYALQHGGDPRHQPAVMPEHLKKAFGMAGDTPTPPFQGGDKGLVPSGPPVVPGRPQGMADGDVSRPSGHPGSIARAPLGVRDGNGVFFVSHTGAVYPSGFMPVLCGRFPTDSVVDVYQNHPTFLSLRDPDQLHGKCGVCDFRRACGGSRARAYAITRDPLGAEPDCAYLPGALKMRPPAAEAV